MKSWPSPSSRNFPVTRDAFAFILLVVVLLVKPTGLFGEKQKEKYLMTAAKASSRARNNTLTVLAIALLFLFLWWADGSMAEDTGLTFLPLPPQRL